MTNEILINIIFEKYKFSSATEEDIKKHILKKRKEFLLKTIRRHAKISIPAIAGIHLMFLLKKFGLHLTLTKSIIFAALSASAGIIAVGAVSGIIYLKHIPSADPTEPLSIPKTLQNDSAITVNEPEKKPVTAPINYKLQIASFRSDTDDKDIAAAFEKALLSEMKIKYGDNSAALMSETNSYTAPNIITGSIIRSENSITISVRLVEEKTSAVKLMTSEIVESEEEMSNCAKIIAAKIIKSL